MQQCKQIHCYFLFKSQYGVNYQFLLIHKDLGIKFCVHFAGRYVRLVIFDSFRSVSMISAIQKILGDGESIEQLIAFQILHALICTHTYMS